MKHKLTMRLKAVQYADRNSITISSKWSCLYVGYLTGYRAAKREAMKNKGGDVK